MRLALAAMALRSGYLWAWQQTIGSGLCHRLLGRQEKRRISATPLVLKKWGSKEARLNDVDGKATNF